MLASASAFRLSPASRAGRAADLHLHRFSCACTRRTCSDFTTSSLGAMAMAVESWDDDVDFAPEAPLFTQSVSTVQTSLSSRLSVRSESNVGDDDWNVVLTPNDDQSTTNAILKATQAGIPIPQNVPSSALLGGTIKRLGKKKSRQKIDDDWDNDLEMPDSGLSLKPKAPEPAPTAPGEQEDEFDEWAEGSLGIRFAGTRRNRSTSASAMSPSLGSVTMDSEAEDELKGLELPDNMDFEAMLKKRRAADAELSDLSQASPAIEQPSTINTHKKSKLLSDDNDDFFSDLDFGPSANDLLDTKKRTMNKNLKVKTSRPSQPPAAQRPATTLNFHDKPTDKPTHVRSHIPRPVSGTVKAGSRLAPVLETGATESLRPDRRQTTTTGAQLLRSKRSMPVLGRQQPQPAPKPSAPFLPAGGSNFQSSRAVASQQRAVPLHLRRDSDPNSRPHSPPSRSYSRLSTAFVPETPSRTSRRPELATAALAREAASKRTVTKPARRRNFGDGSELEIFDDLPTSQSKESKFVKAPVARGPPKAMGLRHVASKSDVREPIKRNLAIPDRMTTPAPPPMTPRSPFKGFHEQQQQQANSTPSYLRDTAASRIARETRLGGTGLGPNGQRPRSEGPLMPVSTNWKAQIAARSPHTSPSAQRNKGKRVQPQLIKAIGAHLAKSKFYDICRLESGC